MYVDSLGIALSNDLALVGHDKRGGHCAVCKKRIDRRSKLVPVYVIRNRLIWENIAHRPGCGCRIRQYGRNFRWFVVGIGFSNRQRHASEITNVLRGPDNTILHGQVDHLAVKIDFPFNDDAARFIGRCEIANVLGSKIGIETGHENPRAQSSRKTHREMGVGITWRWNIFCVELEALAPFDDSLIDLGEYRQRKNGKQRGRCKTED